MATDADIEYAWVKGWVQAYHDLWDIFAIANAPETSVIVQALTEAGAALEEIKAMIENYGNDYHPNTVAKQTPFTAMAMIYAVACSSLESPILRDLLAQRVLVKGATGD